MYGGPNFPWQLILSPVSFAIVDNNGAVKYNPNSIYSVTSSGVFLRLENTGILVLYDSNNFMLWASQVIKG